jgi:hypothetical protein
MTEHLPKSPISGPPESPITVELPESPISGLCQNPPINGPPQFLEYLAAKLANCENVRVFPRFYVVQIRTDNKAPWAFMRTDNDDKLTIKNACVDIENQIIIITSLDDDNFILRRSAKVCSFSGISLISKPSNNVVISNIAKGAVCLENAYVFRNGFEILYIDADFNVLLDGHHKDKFIITIHTVEKLLSCTMLNYLYVMPPEYKIENNCVIVGGKHYYIVYSKGEPILSNGVDKIHICTWYDLALRPYSETGIYGNIYIPNVNMYDYIFNYNNTYAGRSRTNKLVELAPINTAPVLRVKPAVRMQELACFD